MPFTITDACTACEQCLDTCPVDAIEPGTPVFVIDETLCCDFEECVVVCPEDAIIPLADA